MLSVGTMPLRVCVIHDHPSYLCRPDVLSLVGDLLTGRRVWFTESHLVLITVFFDR